MGPWRNLAVRRNREQIMLSQLGLKKTCPACDADIRGSELAVANAGGIFACHHCSTVLRWTVGPELALSLGLALLSIPAAIRLSTSLPLAGFLGGLAALILICMWLATRSLRPVLVDPARSQD